LNAASEGLNTMRHPADRTRPEGARAASLGDASPELIDPVTLTPAAPRNIASGMGTPAHGKSDKLAFLTGFLRNPGLVGSVIPSSPQLEDRLVRLAGVARARTVVELGPGTGGTTRAFLRAGGRDLRILAIELSTDFHARLLATHRDPRLSVQWGSAEHIGDFLKAHGLPAPDAVISGIPFSTMPADVGDRIAKAVSEALAPGGCFVAYQVRSHVAHFTTPYMGKPQREWEFINIPPMQVCKWVKPAA
jgi:phosphatidylethanolamine/phosphatidyl-N-methylethanolamine N-methyltransferase